VAGGCLSAGGPLAALIAVPAAIGYPVLFAFVAAESASATPVKGCGPGAQTVSELL
jgi:hypothetical protein